MAWTHISAGEIEDAVVLAAMHARTWELNEHLFGGCYVSVAPVRSFAPHKPKIAGIKVTIKPMTKAEVAKAKAAVKGQKK